MQTTEWMTAAEAAEYLKVERRTLLQWVRQGKTKAFQLSGNVRHVWRFRQSDLDAMLAPSSAGSADGRQQ
jgi:excisionase family DNA binding protein